LRDEVQLLREENDVLRDEVSALRSENEALRRRTRRGDVEGFTEVEYTRRVGRYDDDLARAMETLMSSDVEDDSVGRTHQGSPMRMRDPYEDFEQRPPTLSGEATYARARRPVSGRLGAGLDPEYIDPARLTPKLSGGVQPVDLGFVNSVGADELDGLPYGLIVLDAAGDILFYNETEGRYVGMTPEQVTGMNFFTEVAPCTQVKAFQGRFEDFVAGRLGRTTFFDFAFHFEQGTQNVTIGLSHGRKRGHYNVMLIRR